MCTSKIKSIIASGVLFISCILVSAVPGYANTESSEAVSNETIGSETVSTDDEIVNNESVAIDIVDTCKEHINPIFVKDTLLESKIIESYGNAVHSNECLDTTSQMYNNHIFDDVKSSDWFSDGVKDSYQMKLMSGEAVGKFNPKGNLTVAQTIALASRIHSIYNTGDLSAIPTNSSGKWYDGVVSYAKDNSIIKSSDFSTADMNKPATRGQIAYILSNAVPSNELESINSNLKFSDISGNKYASSINKLAQAGVVAGVSEGKFSPNTSVTRAEASVLITRLVRPSARIKATSTPSASTGRTVYVTQLDKNGTQKVYTQKIEGLTPITVRYGTHTYNSNNQAEYDYVMQSIEDMFAFKGKAGQKYKESLENFKTNKRIHTMAMQLYQEMYGKADEEKAFLIHKLQQAIGCVTATNGSVTGKGDSAYAVLKNGTGDCTADAMIASAVLDYLGYNTKTVANDSVSHEWVMVEIEGKWWHIPSGGFVATKQTYNRNTTNDTFNNKP